MRSAAEWLEDYGASHCNPINKLLHWICVPVIVCCVIGLLWSLPFPHTLAASRRLNAPLWSLCAALFVLAWIGQFIGHAVEGKRPSFFKDLQFLLVGPLWLLADLYRRLGARL